MNELIASIIDRRTIIFANEGRLLKKCFLAVCVLALAFQQGPLGEVVRASMVDAYIQVSVFVGFTLFIFIGLDSLTKFNTDKFLENSKKYHVAIASLFGSLVAVLTATMGDAAFLLLASEPMTGAFIFLLGGTVGMISGYIVDLIHSTDYLQNESKIDLQFEKLEKTFVSKFNLFWCVIFFPGFIIGLLVAFQVDVDAMLNLPKELSLVFIIGSIGAFLSIFMWALNPLSDFQCSTDRSRNYVSRVIDTTNFVTTWVICGFLIFEIFMFFTAIDMKSVFSVWLPFVPLIAILFGFLPGCGPQIIVTTFYLNGYIPLSAEMGNAISNDGDALFPAIALAPKAAIVATLYSAIPAVIVAYGYMYLFE